MATIQAITTEFNLKIACLELHPAFGTAEMVVVKALQERYEIQKPNQN